MPLDYVWYLRERAADFANRAVTTTDPLAAQSFHQLAAMCRESAERLERRAKTPKAEIHPAK